MSLLSTFIAIPTMYLQVNQFNCTGDSLASGMGYNALIWRAPSDMGEFLKEAQKEARSGEGRPIPLPHGTRTPRESRGTGTKRKRAPKDTKSDSKKKKLSTLVDCGTSKKRKR